MPTRSPKNAESRRGMSVVNLLKHLHIVIVINRLPHKLIQEFVILLLVVEGVLQRSTSSERSEDPLSPLENVMRLVSNDKCSRAEKWW